MKPKTKKCNHKHKEIREYFCWQMKNQIKSHFNHFLYNIIYNVILQMWSSFIKVSIMCKRKMDFPIAGRNWINQWTGVNSSMLHHSTSKAFFITKISLKSIRQGIFCVFACLDPYKKKNLLDRGDVNMKTGSGNFLRCTA